MFLNITINLFSNQPIRHPGLKPGVGSGLILRGAFSRDFKMGVCLRPELFD